MKASKSLLLYTSLFLMAVAINLSVWAGIFSISERQEIQIGKQAAIEVERSMPVLRDYESTHYLNESALKMIARSSRPNLNYRLRIIDTPEINAFALPGGFIYVNRGLLEAAETESEFLGVVAHEIAHVTQKHGVEQAEKVQKAQLGLIGGNILLGALGVQNRGSIMNGAQLLTRGAFMKFSRDAEREADRTGAHMMHAAGLDPVGMVSFFDKLAKMSGNRGSSFFSSHPSPQERRSNISNLIASWSKEDLTVDTERFKQVRAHVKNLPKRQYRRSNRRR